MKKEDLKDVMEIDLSEEGLSFDAVELYEQLVVSDDIDEDLDKTHVLYSFCVILGEEFNHMAEVAEAKLNKWVGAKWTKLKNSTRRKYTDHDAKKKIEGSNKFVREKIKISRYRKLYKQLAFGGGKALEIKANNLRQKIFRISKALDDDFNVRDNDVGQFIKSKLKKED